MTASSRRQRPQSLRADRIRVRGEIGKRFPSYAELIDPQPPTVDQIKEALTDGESMLSFYFGRDKSFVWAVPKNGAVAFAAIDATSGDIQSKANKLREALEPQAAMISDIPPFDLALGYELYSLLLKPVEAGWKIALALQADPAKALNLGKQANERVVKTVDLSGFKVLAFATHGLVPGELDGLTQPALALSAPAVAGVEGDGLLTMEEILALKLDADWVVLSACNTGAASGEGAEAASGLGRAFFYAGTRAILVTNWSVHSQSAKGLVTDLFRRQGDDPKLTRAEALRQAMMALMDGAGYLGADGKTEFAYAHPLFWAPYSIIGDGGRR
jgi:CHAT domain-containing protein